jgi:peptidoglycan/xylan/chitin deacetylase (PgdA/CDA1 family)
MKLRVLPILIVAVCAGMSCQREVPVLLFHEVGCDTHDPRDVPPEQLDAELTTLESRGYQPVPLAHILEDHPADLPPHPVAITFDDGAACIYSAAFPILQKHHAPFEIFLVSNWVGPDVDHRVPQELSDGEKVPSLVWPEVRAMEESGLLTVGAHGRGHVRLTGSSAAELESEVVGGRKDLARALVGPIDLFAYPYGAFDRAAVQEVKRAGFAGAVAVSTGTGGKYAYRRRSIHRGLSEQDFSAVLGERWIVPFLNHD